MPLLDELKHIRALKFTVTFSVALGMNLSTDILLFYHVTVPNNYQGCGKNEQVIE